jgi:hypothetical protein
MIVELIETDDGSGDVILPLGDELCAQVGWKTGDVIDWHDNGDGTFTLTKKVPAEPENELVLVEAVSTFRMRYLVSVPKGNKDWALDTVTLGEAEELGQMFIGEQIVSHRVVDRAEALVLAQEDSEYADERTVDFALREKTK